MPHNGRWSTEHYLHMYIIQLYVLQQIFFTNESHMLRLFILHDLHASAYLIRSNELDNSTKDFSLKHIIKARTL